MKLIQATSPDEIESARGLFREYEDSLGISLCFQNFEQELADLPGKYSPPEGRLLLVYADDQLAGCVALRKLDSSACEMKRLFLRSGFRRQGLGRRMVEAIINEGRAIGYERMRLDSLPGKMDKAIALYREVGFKEIAPYCENPVSGATFMELSLVSK